MRFLDMRVLLAAVLIGIVACESERGASSQAGAQDDMKRSRATAESDDWKWYESNEADWKEWEYHELPDHAISERTALEWVARARPGPTIENERLAEDIAGFIFSWTRNSFDQYLAGVESRRVLLASLADAREVDAVYRRVFGKAPANTVAGASALWDAAGQAGRPGAVSREARLAVGESLALSKTDVGGARRLFGALRPDLGLWRDVPPSEALKWIGYSARAFPRATESREAFDALARVHDRLMVAELAFVVRTSTKQYVPVQVWLYRVPETGDWMIESIAHAYPESIPWPY